MEPRLYQQHFQSATSEVQDINLLTSNDDYSGRTAPLTSKFCILYIYSTNIGTEYFKHGIHSPFFFPLQNAVCFINLTYLVPVLFTFYIQGVLKLKKNSGAKRLKTLAAGSWPLILMTLWIEIFSSHLQLHWCFRNQSNERHAAHQQYFERHGHTQGREFHTELRLWHEYVLIELVTPAI